MEMGRRMGRNAVKILYDRRQAATLAEVDVMSLPLEVD